MKKLITLLLFLFILFNVGKSQTSGPNMPETMSFEPVDATDMVNLSSGNFAYVLPILNIPGPSAGFPLALSYHGGISMDQEASWAGLGWTLNPGAINRGVNGYPDDFLNDTSITIVYDDGDTYTQNFVGVNGQIYIFTVGLSVSWGSSWSVEGSVGIGIEYVNASAYFGGGTEGGTGGVRAGVGIPNTPAYLYAGGGTEGLYVGIGVSYEMVNLGISYNFTKDQTSIGLNVGKYSNEIASMNVSLGSKGVSVSGSIGPIGTNFYSTATNTSNVEQTSKGWFVPLGGITFGHSEGSWWYLDHQNFSLCGSLYLNNSYNENEDEEDWRHDGVQNSSFLSDVVVFPFSEESTLNKEKIETYGNLMMPAYDVYSVNAQGLNGTMSPKYYESRLITGQTRVLNEFDTKDGNNYYDNYENEVWYYHIAGNACTDPDKKIKKFDETINPYFYFNGYPTSCLLVHELEFNTPDPNNTNPVWGDFELLPATQSGSEYKSYSDNVDLASNRKVDANFVQYFTNSELVKNSQLARSKGFIETKSIAPDQSYTNPRKNPDLFAQDGIGAFVITGIDGLTYHYALPVYQFDDYHRYQKEGNTSFYLRMNLSKYAYTWLLTAITGPDYIDRGEEGFDEEDYGYWVELEYGKWTDTYFWRTPYTDDESNQFGRKQVYYLNSIETKSHIAYFIKSLREDGTGCSEIKTYTGTGARGEKNKYIPGTSLPRMVSGWYMYSSDVTVNFTYKTTKLLKLDNIVLLDKKNSETFPDCSSGENLIAQEQSSLQISGIYYYNIFAWGTDENNNVYPLLTPLDDQYGTGMIYSYVHYYEDNVLDINDIDQSLYTKVLKTIKFIYEDDDNALCRETPNSTTPNKTKLTLKEVEILGESSKKILPNYEFEYYTYNDNSYDRGKMDRWGFYLYYPDNWSLKSIKTPIGAEINVEYESDSYKTFSLFNDIFQTLDFEKPESSELIGYNQLDIILKIPEPYNMETIVNNIDDIFISMDVAKMTSPPYPVFLGTEYFTEHDAELIETNFGNRTIKVRFTWNRDEFEIVNIQNISVKFSYPNSLRDGGGIRVSNLKISDGVNTYTTNYYYNDPTTGTTSGITTYAPFYGRAFIPYAPVMPAPGVLYEYVTVSQIHSHKTLLKTVYNFEVPEIVTDPATFNFQMGDQFQVENPQLSLPFFGPLVPATGGDHSRTVYARSAVMHNKTSSIGQLKSISTYNADEDLLSKTINHYTDTLGLGVNEETYYYLKNHIKWHSTAHGQSTQNFRFVSTSKINYPSVLSQIETHSGGNVSHTYYDEFDENTSLATEVRQTFSNDAEYKTVIIPAYCIDSYTGLPDGTIENAGMGSKVYNINNKNMLSQNAATFSLKKLDDAFKVIGVNIQTWNNNWDDTYLEWNTGNATFEYDGDDPADANIWRKHKSFAWDGELEEDGSYKDFEDYDDPQDYITNWTNWFGGNGFDNWIKTSEVKRYDHYSSPVEVVDINNDYAATKKDPKNLYTIAVATNASLASFTATSFEDYEVLDGDVRHFGGELIDNYSGNPHAERYRCSRLPDDGETPRVQGIRAHTGDYYLRVPAMTNGPKYRVTPVNGLQTGQKYRASVWMHKTSYEQSMLMAKVYTGSGSTTEVARASDALGIFGDWKLVNLDFEVPENATKLEVSVAGSSNDPAYFDDFRVSPYESAISSYTYDKAGNVTGILNNDNFATKYYYDAAGRLWKTEKETEKGFEKVSTHQYNYAGRISVSPNIQQDFSYEGAENFRFDVIKSSGLGFNVDIPWWMDNLSMHSNYFTIDVTPNNDCNVLRTGEIVITTTPEVEVLKISVTQEAPPPVYNVYLLNACDEPLTANEIYIGQPYQIIYTDCQDPGNHIVNYKVYMHDGASRTLVHSINDQEIDWHGYGEHTYNWLEVPGKPNNLPQWYGNYYYTICVESAADPETYDETAMLKIINGPSCAPEEPIEVYFTNNVPSPFEITDLIRQTYEHTFTWYKSSSANCTDMHLYLEVWENESMMDKMLNDIYLPTSQGPFSGTVTNQNSYTWSFNPWDFEDAIENETNHTANFIEKDEYVYSVRIEGGGTGCIARTNLFYIDGLTFNFN